MSGGERMADGRFAPRPNLGRHVEDCSCPRCTGFLPGNELTVSTHGSYVSPARLSPRVREIADALAPLCLRCGLVMWWRSIFSA